METAAAAPWSPELSLVADDEAVQSGVEHAAAALVGI